MDELDVITTDQWGLTFELLVNGKEIGDVVKDPGCGFPFWLIEDDLPYYPPERNRGEREPNVHVVSVCGCGEYGCGHLRCTILKTDETVTFTNFMDYMHRSYEGQLQFTRENYDRVIAQILQKISEYLEEQKRKKN